MSNHCLIGISGGIAAYKAIELGRVLIEAGAEVRFVLTRSAKQFVTPLTLATISGHSVYEEVLDPRDPLSHIHLARWADQICIAPASADLIAKLAHGLADDLLTTLCLASQAPLFIAPAMNKHMWAHPATQANLQQLQARGACILGPASGIQACRDEGLGRLLEPALIARALLANKTDQAQSCLSGLNILITAGPTREALDPVRYLSNRSSGKMGYALAEAAQALGARVTLISGPTALPVPRGVRQIKVEEAQAMLSATLAEVDQTDIFIAAAAVADYRVKDPSGEKLKKTGEELLTLTLIKNPDILAQVAALPKAPFTVGFAAETQHLREYALEKLDTKKIDMIIANWVGEQSGFEAPDNEVWVYWPGGEAHCEKQPKMSLAFQLLSLIQGRFLNRVESKSPT